MTKRRIVGLLGRGSVIFMISAGIMALFWYHDTLYQYGLLSLVVFGGLGITAMIATISWLTRPQKPVKKKGKVLYIHPQDVTNVALGTVSMIAIPLDQEKPPGMGSVCLAKVDGGRESAFANLAIREVRREIVGDLDYDSLLKMGYPDLESFINGYQEKGFPLSERDVVHLVEFDVLGRI